VGGFRARARQRVIEAETVMQTRQEMTAPDIRKKTDRRLRHREKGSVAGDAEIAMNRYAGPAAHDDAVDQRDIGFRIMMDKRIQPVFLMKKPGREIRILHRGFAHPYNVAAGAERLFA